MARYDSNWTWTGNWDTTTTDNTNDTFGTAVDVDGDTATVRIGPPSCPECHAQITDKRDHATGCPNWGMLPEHWMGE